MNATAFMEDSKTYAKWGDAAVAGWQALPDILLKNQHRLELTTTELVVLINLLSYWWYVDERPFPRVSTLAKRMNVTTRTVQRCLSKLAEKQLLEKKFQPDGKGKMREVFDLEGLVRVLKKFAVTDKDFIHRKNRGTQQ